MSNLVVLSSVSITSNSGQERSTILACYFLKLRAKPIGLIL